MANAIQIIDGASEWFAKFTGPHAAEILELFGTDTIPTAFKSRTPTAIVLAEVQKLNPGVLVFFK